jgi:hydrogenase nickel incorporation protein HypB
MAVITVERKLLKKNDEQASENRRVFQRHNLHVINVLSSPGSGKTTLLEVTLEQLRDRIACGVIEGDVQTDRDAQRIARHNVPVIQIVTQGGCHLDATLVKDALEHLDLSTLDLLFIENVGNLVCPAGFDLGENRKVVIVSTTEGDDKPLKYPRMFRVADTVVINKIDLLPYVEFDLGTFKEYALSIQPHLNFFEASAKTGDGVATWCDWLYQQSTILA